jgi:exportin-5
MDTNRVIEALSLVLSPTTSSGNRSAANQYLESLKTDSNAAQIGGIVSLTYLSASLNNNLDNDDQVRHFGLSLIESTIKLYLSYTPADIEAMKLLAQSLVLRDIGVEKGFIKEKLVSVFVELAKRLWPMQWIEFNNILRAMYDLDVSSSSNAF